MISLSNFFCITYQNRGFYNNDCVMISLQDNFNNTSNGTRIKIIALPIVIGEDAIIT